MLSETMARCGVSIPCGYRGGRCCFMSVNVVQCISLGQRLTGAPLLSVVWEEGSINHFSGYDLSALSCSSVLTHIEACTFEKELRVT